MSKYGWWFLQLIPGSLFVFLFFWALPAIRSDTAYRKAMDLAFDPAQACWEEKYRAKQYEESSHCFDSWERWYAANHKVPELGIHWPWTVWKEAGVTEDKEKP